METGHLTSQSEWAGQFWLPDRADEPQPGVLTFTPDTGLTLSLIGGFDDESWEPQGPGTLVLKVSSREWPVIHGIAENQPVTLLDSFAQRTASHWFGNAVAKQTIRAQQALFGIHLKDKNSQAFSALEVEVENLSEWSREKDMELAFISEEGGARRFQVTIEPSEPRTAEFETGITAVLGRNYRLPGDFKRSRGSIGVEPRGASHLRLQSAEPRALDDWTASKWQARGLVSLAMDTSCAVLRQTLTPSQAALEDDSLSARSEVTLFNRQLVQGQPDADGVEASAALFTLEDVAFAEIMPRWVEVFQRYSATCNMLLSLHDKADGYAQTQVLTIVPAAEALHKAKYRGSMSLKDRLLQLAAAPYPDVVSQIVPNPEAWAKAAKDARNGLAHTGESPSHTILSLYAVGRVTAAILVLNILQELGIPAARVRAALIENASLSQASRLGAEHWPT